MANFINPVFLNPNIPQKRFNEKLKLTKGEVKISFLLAAPTNGTYKVVFIVNVYPKGRMKDPSIIVSPRNLDMQSLRNAIIANIKEYDKQYMILKEFDHRKAIFHLDGKKWFKDTTQNLTPRVHFSKFDRSFKLKKAPPRMIMMDFGRDQFGKFVVKNFKNWLEDSRKEANYFRYLMPESMRNKMRGKIRDMFDWNYDIQLNTITARLKPVWIIALLYATGEAVKQMNINQVKNKSKKELFATKVKKNIKKFDRQKWIDFTKQKFI